MFFVINLPGRTPGSLKYRFSLIITSFIFLIGIFPVHAQPLDIGNRRQVFIDNTFMEKSEGVELMVHQPEKTGEFTIQPEHPWEKG